MARLWVDGFKFYSWVSSPLSIGKRPAWTTSSWLLLRWSRGWVWMSKNGVYIKKRWWLNKKNVDGFQPENGALQDSHGNMLNMGVSINRGTPKWMLYFMENLSRNGWWLVVPLFQETSISFKVLETLSVIGPLGAPWCQLLCEPWRSGGFGWSTLVSMSCVGPLFGRQKHHLKGES